MSVNHLIQASFVILSLIFVSGCSQPPIRGVNPAALQPKPWEKQSDALGGEKFEVKNYHFEILDKSTAKVSGTITECSYTKTSRVKRTVYHYTGGTGGVNVNGKTWWGYKMREESKDVATETINLIPDKLEIKCYYGVKTFAATTVKPDPSDTFSVDIKFYDEYFLAHPPPFKYYKIMRYEAPLHISIAAIANIRNTKFLNPGKFPRSNLRQPHPSSYITVPFNVYYYKPDFDLVK